MLHYSEYLSFMMANVAILVLGIAFLIVNAMILWTDIREQRIPNRYLLALLAMAPVYQMISPSSEYLGTVSVFVRLLVIPVVVFLVYAFRMWSAGDAKYFFVLSCFLPSIDAVPFVANIAVLIVISLFLHCVRFYGIFLFRGRGYIRSFFAMALTDQRDTWRLFLHRYGRGSMLWGVFQFSLVFLLAFISLRLFRASFIVYVGSFSFVGEVVRKYPSYGAFASIISAVAIGYVIRRGYSRILSIIREYITDGTSVFLPQISTVTVLVVSILYIGYRIFLDADTTLRDI